MDKIFTGKGFPDRVFKKDFDFYMMFEFETFFYPDFVEGLYAFCIQNKIDSIDLTSMDLFLPFTKRLNTNEILNNYVKFFSEEHLFKYQTRTNTYHHSIINFTITTNNDQFAFYANRDFEIAVLGFEAGTKIKMFKSDLLNVPVKSYFESMRFKTKITQSVSSQFYGKEYFFTEDIPN